MTRFGAKRTVATPRDRRAVRERLDERDPPAAAGEHEAQEAVDGPAASSRAAISARSASWSR